MAMSDPENKDINYNEDTFRLYMLVRGKIKKINDPVDIPEVFQSYPAYNYFRNYLREELTNKFLNDILLKVFL